ncbi:hypothetical protein [Streptomyces sp. TRM68367]|nr:hypothetical protein [Streptomyces sp. TRM68367]
MVGILVIGRMNVADPSVGPGWEQVVQGAVLGLAILLDRVRARYFGKTRG